eukprot:55648-Alexandrium_andersonii.AAC.1
MNGRRPHPATQSHDEPTTSFLDEEGRKSQAKLRGLSGRRHRNKRRWRAPSTPEEKGEGTTLRPRHEVPEAKGGWRWRNAMTELTGNLLP